jgi:hypothetical protein
MSKLEKNKKKYLPGSENAFRVPEGFFETFPDKIMAQIELSENKPTQKTKILRYLKPVLTMAASFAFIFFIIYVPVQHISSKKQTAKTETNDTSPDLLDYYYLNSHSVLSLFMEQDNQNAQDEKAISSEVVETYLLASLSEYELYELTQ